jgi:aspartate dehydrogenase
MARIGLIGYGAIGRSVVTQFRNAGALASIVAVLVRSGRTAPPANDGLRAVETLDAFLAQKPDIVAELAGQSAVSEYGEAVLRAGCNLLIASIGSLTDDTLRERLKKAAEQARRQVILPAGAIGGIDAIAAMRLAGLTRVTYRSRKPPAAWKGSPAEQATDLDRLKEPLVFYRGTAREAARLYPKNANVAATLALAGLGLDATSVELMADPHVAENIHEVDAEGSSGKISLRLEGRPSPENPRTSALTALSIARTLMNLDAAIAI